MPTIRIGATAVQLSTEEARHVAELLTRAANKPGEVFEHTRFTNGCAVTVANAPEGVIPDEAKEVTKSPGFIDTDC